MAMREYSNAFNGRYSQYSKFAEIFHSGVVYYGVQERNFVTEIRTKYGLNAVFTDLSIYNRRAAISVYVDFEGNTCAVAKELNALVNSSDLPLNKLVRHASESLNAFAEDVTQVFLDAFHYSRDALETVDLYMYDFVSSFMARLYSISMPAIRTYFQQSFGMDGIWRIMVRYEPSITIVADTERGYRRLLDNRDEIAKKCYEIMKPNDHFDLLQPQDVNLLICFKPDLDRDTVNIYSREM